MDMAVATAAPHLTRKSHLLLPNEPLFCPHGHRVDLKVWTLGGDAVAAFRCPYREPPRREYSCDAGVFILGVDGGVRVMWHVTVHELHVLERERMSIKQIRDFLGLRFAA
jgi:hypothetical protein